MSGKQGIKSCTHLPPEERVEDVDSGVVQELEEPRDLQAKGLGMYLGGSRCPQVTLKIVRALCQCQCLCLSLPPLCVCMCLSHLSVC